MRYLPRVKTLGREFLKVRERVSDPRPRVSHISTRPARHPAPPPFPSPSDFDTLSNHVFASSRCL